MAAMRLCSIEGCGKKHRGHGYCINHAFRFKKFGDPLAGRTAPGLAIKWVEGIDLTCLSDDCLIWPFWRFPSGYGGVTHGGRSESASRYVLRTFHGEPPDPKLEAAHSCGRGHEGCVNPKHLRWATSAENKADRISHGTANRGEKHGRTKLSDNEARAIRELKGRAPQMQIAERFGVSVGVVGSIQQGRSFKYLP